jgi:signal recognition particle GTPase
MLENPRRQLRVAKGAGVHGRLIQELIRSYYLLAKIVRPMPKMSVGQRLV